MNTTTERKMVYTRPRKTIALHWFNAACWLVLTVSGMGIIRGDMRFMPYGYAEWMQNAFGGQFNLIVSHSVLGLIWSGVLVLFTALSWREVTWPFLKNVLSITPGRIIADAWSMAIDISHLFGLFKNVKLPPAGRYNGAQRLLGTMILASGALIMLTGTVMFFLFIFTGLMVSGAVFQWSLVAHGFFVGLVWIGLVAHIYYSVIEMPQVLQGMKNGYLDPEFVKHHNPKWYEELKEQGKV